MKADSNDLLSKLEKVAIAITLAVGWLLPNHYLPWTTFHSDAWVSVVLLLLSVILFIRIRTPIYWSQTAAILLAMALFPLIQYQCGLVFYFGTAWLSSEYLLGLLLAYLVAARLSTRQAYELADVLMASIALAALISVFLQLSEWISTDDPQKWLYGAEGMRPSANIGQPNQCGTFLIWGVLATAWGIVRGKIAGRWAIAVFLLLLFGVALTASRTAWIGILILVTAAWMWRKQWQDKHWPWIASGLAIYFIASVLLIQHLETTNTDVTKSNIVSLARAAGEMRPQIWYMFIDAIGHRPMAGYGWLQGQTAQLQVALDHAPLNISMPSSHNLFLDLAVWCGIPIGGGVALLITRWVFQRARKAQQAEEVILVLFLLAIANHAMFELPLQYAYMLMPAGLMAGILDTNTSKQAPMTSGRWSVALLCGICAALLAAIVVDYLKIEEDYRVLRFEWAHIKGSAPEKKSNSYWLSQFNGYFRSARMVASRGMGVNEIAENQTAVSLNPSAGMLYKHAKVLALNGRPEEAKTWLLKMCQVVPELQCAAAKRTWDEESKKDMEMKSAGW